MKSKATHVLYAALISLSASFNYNAQTYDILGVKRVNPSQVNAILENNEVKGYYAFSFLDKATKKDNLYNLAILDNNLKQNYSVELTMPKRSTLLEGSYNSNGFCFSFIDLKERILEYLLLDKAGKTVGTYTMEVSRSESALYQSYLTSDEDSYNGGIAAVKGKGFIRFGWEREDGERIVMEMIDNNAKVKWTADSKATSKKSYEFLAPFLVDEKVLITSLTTREGRMSRKSTVHMLFIDVENGKEFFRQEVKNDKYQLAPFGAAPSTANQTYFVYGSYYGLEDNMAKDDPKGLYIQELDLTGKVIAENYCDWEKEMYPMLVTKSKGKIEKNMKTFIHKIVKTNDGKIFAITEQYRKAVSAMGLMNAALGGNGGPAVMKIDLHNMVTFEFDSKIKLKDVTITEKEKTSIQLPQGMGAVDANLLGYMMKQYGNFDYAFTTVTSDKKMFNAAYVNYDRDKDAGSNYTVGNIAYTKDQKIMVDKIKLSNKPTYFYVKEARPGYIAIFEYYRKDKKALIRLEKLNF